MDLSKLLHLNWEKALVLAHVGLQMAFPLRDNYSLVICLIGAKYKRYRQAMTNRTKSLLDADKMVAARKITCVNDLNLGKLATFMEISLPLACH